MAMMSHTCLGCGAVYHDNDYSPGKCSVCGGMHFRSHSDEDYEGGNIYDSEEEE